MSAMARQLGRHWVTGLIALLLVLLVACGAASKPPDAASGPKAPPIGIGAAPKAPAAGAPAVAPTLVPVAAKVVSAKDSITLVLPEEPIQLNSFLSLGASLTSPVTKDNLVEPLTWQSGDDLRIVPTGATESWQQVDADTWRFQLRQGVKFHNGEAWNAQAALPSLAFLGIGANNNSSYPYTGGFKAEAAGEYTIDINCDQPCPIFLNTAFFVSFEAPGYLAANPKDENRARQSVGFGPYKLVKWEPGVSITQEAYPGYVPAGNHFEFQKPLIRNLKWVWRGEATVMSAMVKTNEADIAWDVGVDQVKALPKEWIRSGSSAETFAMTVNTLWHPELKKKNVRLAIVHAINCKELIDNLYGGQSTCRGNVIWPGVVGATERNTAPYKYDPTLARQLLKDANYDPKNVIRIVGRSTRIPKQVEVYEAMQGYMKAVGMNVEINIVEAKTRADLTNCGIGKALNEVLEAQGKDPKKDKPALADMQAAVNKGGANCPTGMLIENEPSNETLDFGRQMNFYMNCIFPRSLVCDPSPGGIQEQIAPALAASGAERQRLMSLLADRLHDDVLFISGFDLPVIYAANPKLNWKTRFDGRVRAQTMWFSK